jgi:hypothetical protein
MKLTIGILTASALLASAIAQTATADLVDVVIDVVDWSPSEFYSFGDPTSNPSLTLDLGVGAEITGIYWNLNVTASGGANLSQLGMVFYPAEQAADLLLPGLTLTPGSGDTFGGTKTYTGFVPFTDPPGSFNSTIILPSGLFYIEAFRWNPQVGDILVNGQIILNPSVIPAPGALALLGIAGLAGMRRRRR